jgi:hypothetical protein
MPQRKEEEVVEPTDREKLGGYYNLDVQLPGYIKDKVNADTSDETASLVGSLANAGFSSMTELERSLGKLSPLEREAMAVAVLNGTYRLAMLKPERKRSKSQSAYSKKSEETPRTAGAQRGRADRNGVSRYRVLLCGQRN